MTFKSYIMVGRLLDLGKSETDILHLGLCMHHFRVCKVGWGVCDIYEDRA